MQNFFFFKESSEQYLQLQSYFLKHITIDPFLNIVVSDR